MKTKRNLKKTYPEKKKTNLRKKIWRTQKGCEQETGKIDDSTKPKNILD